MAEPQGEDGRRIARRIVLTQFGLAAALGVGCWLLAGARAGYSALTGGLIGALANWAFARWVFRGGPVSSEQFLGRIWTGELLKLAATVVMFLLALTQFDLAFLPLIGAFAATLLAYWVALLFA